MTPTDRGFGFSHATLSAALSGLAAIALVGLVLLGCLGGAMRAPAGAGPPANDRDLYLTVIDDVSRGEAYYPAVVREQRSEHYPLRPFLAVRLPTLAVAMAALPDAGARQMAIRGLAILMVAAWAWRLRTLTSRVVGYASAMFMVAAATVPAFMSYGYCLHELWAGVLIALSLALYAPRRWPLSLAIALVAVAIRELAAPYLLVMAVFAWRDHRRGEALAWTLALAAFFAALVLHAGAVAPLIRPDDIASPGWLGLGGWKFELMLLKWNGVLLTSPDWVVALLAPAALLGLLSARGPTGDRLALTVVGYGATFLVLGRPDNAYWGLIFAPLWPIGLLWTGSATRGLVQAIRLEPDRRPKGAGAPL